MSKEEREEIFSKDYLTISDIQKLLGLNYDGAARMIRNIRRRYDRLKMQGKIHVQDYLDYFEIPSESRYEFK